MEQEKNLETQLHRTAFVPTDVKSNNLTARKRLGVLMAMDLERSFDSVWCLVEWTTVEA